MVEVGSWSKISLLRGNAQVKDEHCQPICNLAIMHSRQSFSDDE